MTLGFCAFKYLLKSVTVYLCIGYFNCPLINIVVIFNYRDGNRFPHRNDLLASVVYAKVLSGRIKLLCCCQSSLQKQHICYYYLPSAKDVLYYTILCITADYLYDILKASKSLNFYFNMKIKYR